MPEGKRWIPPALVATAIVALAVWGTIVQPGNYHRFADQRVLLGVPNGADVLSNLAFTVAGLWGLWALRGRRGDPAAPGYCVFFAAVLATTLGSGYYHLAPTDARLVWDRLPIAIACAGLIAAIRAETQGPQPMWVLPALVAFAIASIAWWDATGDLRPYVLFQGSILLIPLWQWIYGAPLRDRGALGAAIGLYGLAKVFEFSDRAVYEALGVASGHTIKHLLAGAAVCVIAANVRRSGLNPPGRTAIPAR